MTRTEIRELAALVATFTLSLSLASLYLLAWLV